MKEILSNWMAILSIGMILVGIYVIIKGIYDRVTAIRLEGEIVDVVHDPQGAYFPLIQFTYEGQEYNMQGDAGQNTPKFQIGKQVKIYYRPKNQEYVLMAGKFTDILIGFVVIVIAVCKLLSELQ